MSEEIWAVCSCDEGYEVSNHGRVRGRERLVNGKTHSGSEYRRTVKARILTPWTLNKTGYLQVSLSMRKKYSVHRLVALAFCDGASIDKCVNHKNGNRADNRKENLEWVTWSENCAHAFRELGRVNQYKGKFGKEHPKSRAVVATCIANGNETDFESASDAARAGFVGASISKCCRGLLESHAGYRWRYAK